MSIFMAALQKAIYFCSLTYHLVADTRFIHEDGSGIQSTGVRNKRLYQFQVDALEKDNLVHYAITSKTDHS